MARTNYGRVGGRRSSSAVWQWMIIGMVLGLACSAVVVLTLLTVGILNLDGAGTDVAALPSVTAAPTQNVQATVDIVVRQTLEAIPTATAQPTDPPAAPAVVEPPTPTPTTDPALLQPTETEAPTATTQAANPPAQQTGGQNTAQNAQATPTTQGSAAQPNTNAALGTGGQNAPAWPVHDLVEVQGGTFQMGTNPQEIAIAVRECQERDAGQDCREEYGQDSLPIHNATINSFLIEEYEVTNAQYVAFLNSLGPGSHLSDCGGQKCIDSNRENENSYIRFDSANYSVQDIFSDFPAAGVTWYGAQAYCQAIGRRLPTEAEWERAARGPNGFLYPWGNQWDGTLARHRLPGVNDPGPVAVGTYGNASSFGAFDMAGNVAEWVQDFYSANYYAQPAASEPNPQGPPSGTTRVKRGGSWDTLPFFLRSVHRQDIAPDSTLLSQGFRCADDIDTQAQTNQAIQPIAEVTDEAPLGAAPTIPPRQNNAGQQAAPTATSSSPQLPPTPPGGQ